MFMGSLREITNDAGPRCAPHRARSLAVANVPMEGSARMYCQVNLVLVHACNPTARPACSSGGSCSDSLADEAWSGANCSTISAPSLKRGLCGPCPTEADDSSAGGVARSMMRSCVHAEMKIDTRGRAECRCASTALLVGKRGLAAEARALVHSRHGPLSVGGASCLQALV